MTINIKNIIIALVLSVVNQSVAQTNCKNEVSTNPILPTNNNLPNLLDGTGNVVSTGNKYLNGFDWLQANGSIYTQYNSINMMFNGSPYVMNNIMSYSIPQYEYISQEVAPLLINGWELMLVNLGYFPNSVDIIPVGANDNTGFPYIVLYNKYSGIIRVFTNFGEDSDAGQGGNALEITLGFITSGQTPNVSGLLRLYGGQDQTLDAETDVTKMTSIVVKPAQGSHWASTDFQITYDPCTCFYISKLNISIKSILNNAISLNGLAITQTTDLVDANGNLSPFVDDFINGFERTYSPNDKEGMIIYKNIQYALDEYIKKYENYETQLYDVGEHNAKVKENLLLLKAAKVIVAALTGNVVNSAIAVVSNDANSLWTKVKSLNKGYTTLQTNGVKLFDTKKVMKVVKSILGETGETFITNNFEVQNAPAKPSMPSVTLTEMKYNGLISSVTDVGGVSYYSPGVYGSQHLPAFEITNYYEYPVYNEVLGVFALLESPKIIISEEIIETKNEFDYKERVNPITFNNEVLTKRYQNWEHNYQIQLDEDLKFALNDVLDIKSYEIKASYSVKALVVSLLPAVSNSFINARQGTENVNIDAINSDVFTVGYPIISDYKSFEYYQVTTIDTNWFTFSTVPTYYHNQDSAIHYQTPYVPIDAFQPYTAGVSLLNESISFNDYVALQYDPLLHIGPSVATTHGYKYDLKVELKLMVDVVFNSINSDGVNNSTTLLLTYKINPNDITYQNSPIIPNLSSSLANISQYPSVLNFGDTHFSGQNVSGCVRSSLAPSGDFYVCYANDFIYIDGDITVANDGTQVLMRSGNEIYVVNESNISPEVILEIFPLFDYSQPMPQVNQVYVTNFCTNATNGYLANTPRNLKAKDSINQIQTQNNTSKEIYSDIEFTLFPNPTKNSTTVIVNDIRNENLSIKITDLAGKQINVGFDKQNSNTFVLDVSNLESGIYFVTVSTYGGSKTKRLIVN